MGSMPLDGSSTKISLSNKIQKKIDVLPRRINLLSPIKAQAMDKRRFIPPDKFEQKRFWSSNNWTEWRYSKQIFSLSSTFEYPWRIFQEKEILSIQFNQKSINEKKNLELNNKIAIVLSLLNNQIKYHLNIDQSTNEKKRKRFTLWTKRNQWTTFSQRIKSLLINNCNRSITRIRYST